MLRGVTNKGQQTGLPHPLPRCAAASLQASDRLRLHSCSPSNLTYGRHPFIMLCPADIHQSALNTYVIDFASLFI